MLSRRKFGAVLATLGATPLRAILTRPKLLVLLVVDQFRPDYLDNAIRSFVSGGLRRLLAGGSFFPDCRVEASTFSSSSLATMVAGCYPDAHGIIADHWFDRSRRKVIPAAATELRATTLGQSIAEDRANRVYAVGMDELSANLLAPFPSAQVFNLSPQSEFMARKDEPAWLADYRGSHGVEPLQNANWVALGARSDAPPLRVLSYDPASPAEFHMLYRASPFAQAAQFDFARELVVRERLGQTDGFDVLLLSLGSTALLGYETGAFSPLMSQMVLHLDRQIESLLNLLDKQLGTGNFTFVFAGAHGAPPAREGAAVSGEAVARGIDRSLSARYDMSSIKNTYVDRYVYPFLYLKTEQLRRYDIPLREARRTAGELAMELPGVAAYYTADDDCSHQGPWRRWFRNSFHAARSGDVMLGYLPGCVEDYAGGRGVSYGSMYTYDTRVPLILYGPQFRSQVFENTVELVDVAPTLSRSCGVAVPSSSIGRVLADTFESRTGR